MVEIMPLEVRFLKKIKRYGLQKKFDKQITLFRKDPFHPSLHTELLEPKAAGIYSLRIDRKYRLLFFFNPDKQAAQILNITVHYH